MFSRRTDWQPETNRLTRAREQRLRSGAQILDLTISNPTRARLSYPLDELSAIMARAAREPYDPQPLGLPSARHALAASLRCETDDVVITASTSEAYAFLFKLLTDPGDDILTAVPSYPLFDHLAQMEHVTLRTFPLELHRRWEIVAGNVERALTRQTRAIAAVSPNNPTGSYVTGGELAQLSSFGLPLILDEVFREYPLDGIAPEAPSVNDATLTFRLGGLSKSAGLPHYKLGWIQLSGPAREKRMALEALELIADNFLSVATPVQAALPDLLRAGNAIRAGIRERTSTNLESVRSLVKRTPSIEPLPVEAGWSLVLRVPRTRTDEELALELLEAGVLVQPGYFFDFPADGFLVVSLLTPHDELMAGIHKVIEVANR